MKDNTEIKNIAAEENVLYDSKPHIGTDKLRNVVVNLRNKIIELGGTVKLNAKFVDFNVENGGRVLVKFIARKY